MNVVPSSQIGQIESIFNVEFLERKIDRMIFLSHTDKKINLKNLDICNYYIISSSILILLDLYILLSLNGYNID